MSGPKGFAFRGRSGPQSVQPMRVPGGAREAIQQMQAEAEAEIEFENRREHFAALAKIHRFGVHDATGCPKCGQKELGKVHCPGRLPRATPQESQCFILGGHLHCQCGTCRYVWVEHSKDDDLELDWRGTLRHDETRVDGNIMLVEGIVEPETLWRFTNPVAVTEE